MDPLTALVVLAALGGVAGLGGARAARRERREWACTWNGHALRLVARPSRKELWVDGERVARKTTLRGAGASLAWTLPDSDGQPVVITATIAGPDDRAPVGRLYAAGRWIGGDADGGTPLPPPTAPLPEPADPRWGAARVLLADLRGASDARVREAAARVEAGLRDVLARLDRLGATRDAHAALGGEPAQIEAARARLDGQAAELVDALRELHLVALAEGSAPALAPIEDLLARVSADAEVANAGGAAARRAGVTSP